MTSELADSLETASLDISIWPGPVVTVSGEIDIESGPQLRDQLLCTIRRHGARLALDLSGVTFIDCAGINALLAARRYAQFKGGWLRVTRASARVQRVLALTRLHHVLMPTAWPDAAASSESADSRAGLVSGAALIAAGRERKRGISMRRRHVHVRPRKPNTPAQYGHSHRLLAYDTGWRLD